MKRRFGVACALGALSSGMSVVAAPLAPPAGPVTETGARQILAIPFTISSPGSYRLSQNVTMGAAANGIVIASGDVTLDLGGHSLNGGGVGIEGIVLTGPLTNVTIRNGTIFNWQQAGIWEGVGGHQNVHIENISIYSTGLGGIEFFSSQVTVDECTTNFGSLGISAGPSSIVRNSRSDGAVGAGIFADFGSQIENCVVLRADSFGIATGDHCVVENVSVNQVEGVAIMLGSNSALKDSVVQLTTSPAIAASLEGRLTLVDSRTGAPLLTHALAQTEPTFVSQRTQQVTPNPLYAHLTAEGPSAIGIAAGVNSRVENCIVGGTQGDGVVLGAQSTVQGTTVTSSFNGIVASLYCEVVRCHVASNFGVGILVNGQDNRIESNTTSLNSFGGIVLNQSFNRVVRNDMSLDGLVVNVSNVLPPSNDFTNPWSNFMD